MVQDAFSRHAEINVGRYLLRRGRNECALGRVTVLFPSTEISLDVYCLLKTYGHGCDSSSHINAYLLKHLPNERHDVQVVDYHLYSTTYIKQ